ncbi:hypothetical protein ZIOFF_020447 [Zingiber officinale]|uniref:Transmembrane protein n=1 Tax=Zingiber officinale TaxID=94328 RepID=A0A8J5LIT6_ZINOF|nr:hypothetical protein ZIOFF_020447 [Zingiber officinale]
MQRLRSCGGSVAHLSAILFFDIVSFLSFLASHPLHSTYLFLFLPRLLPLLRYLSPLLLSTSALFFLLLTASPYFDRNEAAAAPRFLGATSRIVLLALQDGLRGREKIDLLEQFASLVLSPIDDASPSSRGSAAEVVFGQLPLADHAVSAHETEQPSQSGSDSALRPTRNRSHSDSSELVESLQRYGSVRNEREWKRTLACKLYEERMTQKLCKEREVAEGEEDMDLLWEAYEANADPNAAKTSRKKKVKKEKERDAVKQEEEEEPSAVQLCCLDAFRLSAGKMNLGMGKRNLAKLSKVFKGMKKLTRSGSKE